MTSTSNDPDRIREQIEITRGQLSEDVNALAEGARPSTMVRRRMGRMRSSLSGTRHRLMGTPDEGDLGYRGPGYQAAHRPASQDSGSVADTARSAMSSVGDTAHSAVDTVTGAAQQAPTTVRERTEGNPLAVGLIAFGVGYLAASLMPATEVEQHAAERVKEQAEPLVHKAGEVAKESAQEMKEHLQEPARDAARSVQETATGAAATVKDEAAGQARQVTESRSS